MLRLLSSTSTLTSFGLSSGRNFSCSVELFSPNRFFRRNMSIKLVNQAEAIEIDEILMSETGCGFSVDQLMELAGLSVSQACYKCYPVEKKKKALLIVGPGNNGGDALVCARHLYHYNYDCTIWQPKDPKKQLYKNLNKQCKQLGIPILQEVKKIDGEFDFIVDGIFGFSFKGKVRSPYDKVVEAVNKSKLPVLSIDVPSGWEIEEGNVRKEGIEPEVLISLTAPKICSKFFKGKHFLGGRFVPPDLARKFELKIPSYKGIDQVVEL